MLLPVRKKLTAPVSHQIQIDALQAKKSGARELPKRHWVDGGVSSREDKLMNTESLVNRALTLIKISKLPIRHILSCVLGMNLEEQRQPGG